MVPPHEVVLELNNSFSAVGVVLFQKKEQLGFNGCLIIVLLLVLDHLDRDVLTFLVISAPYDLSEGALADELAHFKSVADLVTTDDSVVPLGIVKSVVDQSLFLRGLVLLVWLGNVPDFFIFLDFCQFVVVQEVL